MILQAHWQVLKEDCSDSCIEKIKNGLGANLLEQIFDLVKDGGRFNFGKIIEEEKEINETFYGEFCKVVLYSLYLPYFKLDVYGNEIVENKNK